MKYLVLILFSFSLSAQISLSDLQVTSPSGCENEAVVIAHEINVLNGDSTIKAWGYIDLPAEFTHSSDTNIITPLLNGDFEITDTLFYRQRVAQICQIGCCHKAVKWSNWLYTGEPLLASITGYNNITGEVYGTGIGGNSYEYYIDCGQGFVLGNSGCQTESGGDTFSVTLENGCLIKEVVYIDENCTQIGDEDIKTIPTPDVAIDTTGFETDSLAIITFANLSPDVNAIDSNYVCLYANGSQWCLPAFEPNGDIDVTDLEPCSIGTGGVIELDWNCFGYETLVVEQCITHYYPDALPQIVCTNDTLSIVSTDPLCCQSPQINYTDWTFTAGEAGAGQTGINLGANVGSYVNTIATHGDINNQPYTLTITDLTGVVFYTLNDNFDATGAINGTTGINVDGSNFGADGTYVATISTTTTGGANISHSISFSIIAGNYGIPDPNANLGVAPKFIGSKDQPTENNRNCPLNWGVDLLGINGSSIDTGVPTLDVGTVEIIGVGVYSMNDFVELDAGLYEFITETQIPNSQLTVNQTGWIEIVPCQ